jgi:hypothetical protein
MVNINGIRTEIFEERTECRAIEMQRDVSIHPNWDGVDHAVKVGMAFEGALRTIIIVPRRRTNNSNRPSRNSLDICEKNLVDRSGTGVTDDEKAHNQMGL